MPSLQAISAIKPDENRAKEFLEQFTFDSLRMVGTLERGGDDWTLIQDPEGGVHRVQSGTSWGATTARLWK